MENVDLLISEPGVRKRLGHKLTSGWSSHAGGQTTEHSLPAGDGEKVIALPLQALYNPWHFWIPQACVSQSGAFFFLNTIPKKVFCGQIIRGCSP